MDSFEIRQQFIKTVQRLTASSKSQDVVIQFLLKYPEYAEDLYRKMLDELSRAPLNARVNIIYLLDVLAGVSLSHNLPFHHWIATDLPKIMDLSVPTMTAALANVADAEAVAQQLAHKRVISPDVLPKVKEHLAKKAAYIRSKKIPSEPEIPREEILRRMEEDRERTKKVKERAWAVDMATADEFTALWSQDLVLTDLDYEQMNETNEIARESKLGVFL